MLSFLKCPHEVGSMVTSFYRQIKLRWIKQFVQNSLGIKTYITLWVAVAWADLAWKCSKQEIHFTLPLTKKLIAGYDFFPALVHSSHLTGKARVRNHMGISGSN